MDAHLLILQDKLFVDRIIETIQERAVNAEWAIQQVSDELYEAYDRLQDDYLRERRGDLEDIVRRMLHNLRSKSQLHVPSAPLRRHPRRQDHSAFDSFRTASQPHRRVW